MLFDRRRDRLIGSAGRDTFHGGSGADILNARHDDRDAEREDEEDVGLRLLRGDRPALRALGSTTSLLARARLRGEHGREMNVSVVGADPVCLVTGQHAPVGGGVDCQGDIVDEAGIAKSGCCQYHDGFGFGRNTM